MYRSPFILFLLLPQLAFAAFYPAPAPGNDIIGEPKTITLHAGQNLLDIARENEVGLHEILEANPALNPRHFAEGTEILIPSQYILPKGARDNVVVNIAELRLYFFPPGNDFVFTVPVGIGRRSWETPVGDKKILDKREHPTWTAPISVRKAMAEKGVYVPPVMPPGPANPLGDHAMRISMMGDAIHGTNRPNGVGRRVSAGCIRLSPDGMKDLFDLVDIGTPVHIVNEPFKAGWQDGQLYFEAHQPLYEQKQQYGSDYTALIKNSLSLLHTEAPIDIFWAQIKQVAYEQIGVPQQINQQIIKKSV